MTIKSAIITGLAIGLIGSSMVNASEKCFNVSANTGQIMFNYNCTEVWNALKQSRKFPYVFSNQQQPGLYPGVCFVSTVGGIPAKLGNQDVTVTSASAWTTDFYPSLPPFLDGPDKLASVISAWKIWNTNNLLLGSIYAVDTVDLVSGNEQDVIIGGSGKFKDASGAVRIDSSPDAIPGLVNITNISGRICVPD